MFYRISIFFSYFTPFCNTISCTNTATTQPNLSYFKYHHRESYHDPVTSAKTYPDPANSETIVSNFHESKSSIKTKGRIHTKERNDAQCPEQSSSANQVLVLDLSESHQPSHHLCPSGQLSTQPTETNHGHPLRNPK